MKKIIKAWVITIMLSASSCNTANTETHKDGRNNFKNDLKKNITYAIKDTLEVKKNFQEFYVEGHSINIRKSPSKTWEIFCHVPQWVKIKLDTKDAAVIADGYLRTPLETPGGKLRVPISTSDHSKRFLSTEKKENKEWLTSKYIKIDKKKRKMYVYENWEEIKELNIWLWYGNDTKDKIIEWDGNTPEWKYYMCNKNPASNYGENPKTWWRIWSLMVSYPNTQDAFEWLISWDIKISEYNRIKSSDAAKSVPSQDTKLWNYIMIHGWGASDWTGGCIAIENEDMMRLYNFLSTWADIIIY